MTKTELLALALDAVDAPEARVVLADAIEELGWWDPRVIVMFTSGATIYAKERAQLTRMLAGGAGSGFMASLGIATVLLFEDWVDTSKPGRRTWSLAERCTPIDPTTMRYWEMPNRVELTVRFDSMTGGLEIEAANVQSRSWCHAHRMLDEVFETFRARATDPEKVSASAEALASALRRLRPTDQIVVKAV